MLLLYYSPQGHKLHMNNDGVLATEIRKVPRDLNRQKRSWNLSTSITSKQLDTLSIVSSIQVGFCSFGRLVCHSAICRKSLLNFSECPNDLPPTPEWLESDLRPIPERFVTDCAKRYKIGDQWPFAWHENGLVTSNTYNGALFWPEGKQQGPYSQIPIRF